MNIGRNSLVAVFLNNAQAIPFTRYVEGQLESAQASAGEQAVNVSTGGEPATIPITQDPGKKPKIKLDPESIIEILQHMPDDSELSGLKSKLPKGEKDLQDLARVIFYQLKVIGLARQGAYGDVEAAKPLMDEADTMGASVQKDIFTTYREQMEEALLKHLPKLMLANQKRLQAMHVLIEPLLQDLFCGNFEHFKTTLSPICGGNIPYESLVKFTFDAINKEENNNLKQRIQDLIQSLVNRELPEGDEDAAVNWQTDANELVEMITGKRISLKSDDLPDSVASEGSPESIETSPGLITQDELQTILTMLKEIPQSELLAVGEILQKVINSAGENFKQAGPLLSVIFSSLNENIEKLFSDPKQFWFNTLSEIGEQARAKINDVPSDELSIPLLLLAGLDKEKIASLFSHGLSLPLLLKSLDHVCDVATSHPQTAMKLQLLLLFAANNPHVKEYLGRLGYSLDTVKETADGKQVGTKTLLPKSLVQFLPLIDKLLPVLDNALLATILNGVGLDVKEIKQALRDLKGNVGTEEASGNSSADTKDKTKPGNEQNKFIPWVLGLAGAVIGLSGYIFNGEKVKGFLSGIGAFGLVGTIVAAVKRAGVEGDKTLGWLEGKGAWITGIGGAILSGIPFLMTQDKVKGSIVPIGLGIIGGVLAWFSQTAQSAFGLPTALAAQTTPEVTPKL